MKYMQLSYEITGDNLDVVLRVERQTDVEYELNEFKIRDSLGQILEKQRFGKEDRILVKDEDKFSDIHNHVYKGSANKIEELANIGADILVKKGIDPDIKELIAKHSK
jgi:hypothetical protein